MIVMVDNVPSIMVKGHFWGMWVGNNKGRALVKVIADNAPNKKTVMKSAVK